MLGQCGFISYKNCTTLVGDADARRGYVGPRAGSLQFISVHFPLFYCKPKTAPKKLSLKKKNQLSTHKSRTYFSLFSGLNKEGIF